MTFFLIVSVIVVCTIFYLYYTIVNRKSNNLMPTDDKFSIIIHNDNIIDEYVQNMPLQYKDNERLLSGSGKMHFSEISAEGSELVKNNKISVLKAVGGRFS